MSSFPLLHLPSKELSKVLRHMDPISQFGCSLLSKKSKPSILKIPNLPGFHSVRLYVLQAHFLPPP
ncbi:F-box domain-containing protein [Caenorhabditis elegans]|uniref:F-box domain-containing protein n=1 Tax=Caenorhabditis elegans TaxID=6239 RepID=A0A1C3NSH7_CAEEL|nr:F-box domain-containing protein [Caenorhabditis elegans]SBV53359.1 F-box domain-containing protein [Caenorhabditis elegans]|eukprot:NP_001317869.1 Uncharacterized protein CELE_F36H5.17 [Caenorhabditis elegans]